MFDNDTTVIANGREHTKTRLRTSTLGTVADVTEPNPPPEGIALEAARERLGISQREAARRAGISETRWRQITKGFHKTGGVLVPNRGPAETIARMAVAVEMEPDRLIEADRDDAYAFWIKQRNEARRRATTEQQPNPALADASHEELLAELARRLGAEEVGHRGNTTPMNDQARRQRIFELVAIVGGHHDADDEARAAAVAELKALGVPDPADIAGVYDGTRLRTAVPEVQVTPESSGTPADVAHLDERRGRAMPDPSTMAARRGKLEETEPGVDPS